MKIVIEGIPIPKARARIFKKGTHFSAYDPQSQEKNIVSMKMKQQSLKEGHKFDRESIFMVDMWFYIPYPKSCDSGQIKQASWGVNIIPPQRPDVSNYVKFYEDAANTILWHDDSSIIDLEAHKRYSENPRTEIEIMTVQESSLDSLISFVIKAYDPAGLESFVDICRNISEEYEKCDKSAASLYGLSRYMLKLADEHGEVLKKILQKSRKYSKN